MNTVALMTERIERGAALLDERRPGWEAEIDLDRLNLASSTDCVLGQLWGSREWVGYTRGLKVLRLGDYNYTPNAKLHGFTLGLDSNAVDYRRLTYLWHDLIVSRRRVAIHEFALVA